MIEGYPYAVCPKLDIVIPDQDIEGFYCSKFLAKEENNIQLKMKNLKVVNIHLNGLEFDNGMLLSSYHEQDCCEYHYLSFYDLGLEDFEGLEFDLSNDDFFEKIEGYGIALKPTNGYPIRIPGYSDNNGDYSSDLELIICSKDGKEIYKRYDISECQQEQYNINARRSFFRYWTN
jgi:hypothetical protein